MFKWMPETIIITTPININRSINNQIGKSENQPIWTITWQKYCRLVRLLWDCIWVFRQIAWSILKWYNKELHSQINSSCMPFDTNDSTHRSILPLNPKPKTLNHKKTLNPQPHTTKFPDAMSWLAWTGKYTGTYMLFSGAWRGLFIDVWAQYCHRIWMLLGQGIGSRTVCFCSRLRQNFCNNIVYQVWLQHRFLKQPCRTLRGSLQEHNLYFLDVYISAWSRAGQMKGGRGLAV